jgi:hypothetical protein
MKPKKTIASHKQANKKLKISRAFKEYFLARLEKHKYLNFGCIESDFDPESLFVAAEQCLPSIDELTNSIQSVIEVRFGGGDAGHDFIYQVAQLCGVPNQNNSWKSIFERQELKHILDQINLGFWDTYEGLSLWQSSRIVANEFLELPKKYNKKLLEHPICEGILKSNEMYAEQFGDDV